MSSDFYTNSILPYKGIITKICRSYTYNNEDFEDYYQEVCLQIWKSRNNFKGNSEWSTWVYRISLNVCMTIFKKKKIQKLPLFDSDQEITNQPEQYAFEKEEEINRLYNTIRQLPKVDRAYILLYLEEKSYKEIAEILGTQTTNVGVKINRIKKKLKKLYYGN